MIAADVSEQSGDYSKSQSIAKARGGRPITLQEAIQLARSDPNLFEKIEGKWFYIDGRLDAKMNGFYKVNYENGTLEQVPAEDWNALPYNDRAYVYGGSRPPSLLISRGAHGERFAVYGIGLPTDVAPVVVVVPLKREVAKAAKDAVRQS